MVRCLTNPYFAAETLLKQRLIKDGVCFEELTSVHNRQFCPIAQEKSSQYFCGNIKGKKTLRKISQRHETSLF